MNFKETAEYTIKESEEQTGLKLEEPMRTLFLEISQSQALPKSEGKK